jgi:crotonobetainyl-CoA:carnitine CoA-transferase CaiB-like acyl-CoA transferase
MPTDHSPPDAGRDPTDRRGPLDGLLVADLSRVLAGPYCSMLLADLGATVVKVESPAGDDTRTWMPPEKDGVSTYFMSVNRNKRSVVLDFRDPDDVALVHELYRRADIAIENFKPGGLARFDLDYDTARALNPALIYLSISGFGTAEGAWLPGYDLVVQAVSGLMSLTGEADGPAYRAGISVFDVMTGLHGTIGVLAALNQRNETGEGQHVEVNLLSSALSGLVNQTGAYTAGGVVPHRMGNAHPSVYPYEVMPTADRDVIITAANDRQFRALCEVLGIAEVADDERFRLNADRTANRDQIHPLLLERLAEWSADGLFVALNKAGVPCGPINSIGEGVELAERLGLDPRVTLGEAGDAVDLVRNPIGFSAAEVRYDRPPPALGADSESVRAWLSTPADAARHDERRHDERRHDRVRDDRVREERR